jgi:hypothetical protein
MANTLLTPSKIARRALANLYANSVMLPLVVRDYDDEFTGNQGDTVTIRKPATLTANTYSQAVGISIQNATETSTTVKLDKIADVSIALTSTDYALNLDSFDEQFVAPAMEAIAGKIDAAILAEVANISQSVNVTAYNVSTAPHPTFALIDAGRTLDQKFVPESDRAAVLDAWIAASFNKDALTHEADKVGDDGTALRRASIGTIHGFDTVKSTRITSAQGVAFHKSAFAFVSRPMPKPRGAASSEIVNFRGLSVRVVADYNITYKQDVISFDILYGTKTLDANRAVILNGQGVSS